MIRQSKRIWVCINGTYCCRRRPNAVLKALQEEVAKTGAQDSFEIIGGGCLGMCGHGPNAMVMIGRSRVGYSHVKPSDAKEIIAAHTGGDKPVERLKLRRSGTPCCKVPEKKR